MGRISEHIFLKKKTLYLQEGKKNIRQAGQVILCVCLCVCFTNNGVYWIVSEA